MEAQGRNDSTQNTTPRPSNSNSSNSNRNPHPRFLLQATAYIVIHPKFQTIEASKFKNSVTFLTLCPSQTVPTVDIKPTDLPPHPLLANVALHLDAKDLWDQFHIIGTEMIVTKAGRYVSGKTLSVGTGKGARADPAHFGASLSLFLGVSCVLGWSGRSRCKLEVVRGDVGS